MTGKHQTQTEFHLPIMCPAISLEVVSTALTKCWANVNQYGSTRYQWQCNRWPEETNNLGLCGKHLSEFRGEND